jgi:hypothetical protein
LLVAEWDPAAVRGYDPSAAPGTDAHLPLATSLDNVGARYPSLVVTYSNETTGGASSYQFVTPSGPGQRPDGSLVATARAEAVDDAPTGGYSGAPGTYARVDGETIVDELAEHAFDIARSHPQGGPTDFKRLGGQRGPDAPDDDEQTPIVRLAQRTIEYTALWAP